MPKNAASCSMSSQKVEEGIRSPQSFARGNTPWWKPQTSKCRKWVKHPATIKQKCAAPWSLVRKLLLLLHHSALKQPAKVNFTRRPPPCINHNRAPLWLIPNHIPQCVDGSSSWIHQDVYLFFLDYILYIKYHINHSHGNKTHHSCHE